MRRPALLALTLGVIASVACSHSRRTTSPSVMLSTNSYRDQTITAAEIEKTGSTTALDVITMLRPAMLRPRFSVTRASRGASIAVYVDAFPLAAGVAGLSGVRSATVSTIRFLDGLDATTRYGTGHEAGAILVTTVGGAGR
jgi:hypothetical protein